MVSGPRPGPGGRNSRRGGPAEAPGRPIRAEITHAPQKLMPYGYGSNMHRGAISPDPGGNRDRQAVEAASRSAARRLAWMHATGRTASGCLLFVPRLF